MPSILCMQEVLYHQLQDIDKLIGSEYDHISAGREDGDKQGEACPIFWNKELFELLSFEHFWLSDQPHVPNSVGWDAALSRLATLVKLRWRTHESKDIDPEKKKKHKKGETFYVLNTHYDHIGLKAISTLHLMKKAIKQSQGIDTPKSTAARIRTRSTTHDTSCSREATTRVCHYSANRMGRTAHSRTLHCTAAKGTILTLCLLRITEL
ncbi:hypothetical protein P389DRAFT_58330 [Cystobasidium minutum MCA 4210]|uniref:uncharacterized protein n=1 Tax=Cystobasidium minutum MCA 4210 TaxID=1397322 RepID=UPI0034CD702C|eukprot:jgi/Rhomi1/58330/CE58329_4387